MLPDCNNSIKTSRFLTDRPSLPMDYYQRRSLPAGSVTRLQHQAILSTGTGYTSRRSLEMVPTMAVRPDEESRSGGLQEGLPSASDPETEADRTPRGSLLACMTANREPSNQSFETDGEATVCTASRRFLPFERTPRVSNEFLINQLCRRTGAVETLPRCFYSEPTGCHRQKIAEARRRI